jgi:hypothetical protein
MIIRGPKNRWGVIQKLEKPKTNIFSNYFKSKLQQKKGKSMLIVILHSRLPKQNPKSK